MSQSEDATSNLTLFPLPSNPTSNPKTDIMLEDVPERNNNVGFDVACVLDGNNKNVR